MKFLSIITILLFSISCTTSRYQTSPATPILSEEVQQARGEQDRKIVLEATIKIESELPIQLHQSVIEMAIARDGYVLKAENQRSTVRLPASAFQDFLSSIEPLGLIKDRQIIGKEVTEEFFDLNIRLESTLKSRDRYLSLLEETQSIDENLRLERELERLNQDIDRLQGQLNRLSHLTDYATVTIITTQQLKPGPISQVANGVFKAIKWLFVWG